ncbi:MAG: membrane protein insertion efficiency factor YidD [Bacteriovoracaceae bacterium]|nr:membrane protein insertion efficiency factor YidD [Bacteriovoracaceae bacterium]
MRFLAIFFIQLYRYLISPFLGPNCRFTPSCSHYALSCFERFSPPRAMWYTTRRILRCHPWNAGGYDPAPDCTHEGN